MKSTFASQFDLIEQRMHEDPDFQDLCADFERAAGMVEFLVTLMADPRDGIRLQFEREAQLLRELEIEIRMFLGSESDPGEGEVPI